MKVKYKKKWAGPWELTSLGWVRPFWAKEITAIPNVPFFATAGSLPRYSNTNTGLMWAGGNISLASTQATYRIKRWVTGPKPWKR